MKITVTTTFTLKQRLKYLLSQFQRQRSSCVWPLLGRSDVPARDLSASYPVVCHLLSYHSHNLLHVESPPQLCGGAKMEWMTHCKNITPPGKKTEGFVSEGVEICGQDFLESTGFSLLQSSFQLVFSSEVLGFFRCSLMQERMSRILKTASLCTGILYVVLPQPCALCCLR